MQGLPELLRLKRIDEGRFEEPHPKDDPEGWNVIFSGQLIARRRLARRGCPGRQVHSDDLFPGGEL
jgi:hypothetical protein